MSIIIKMVVAGISFGLWPVFMNRSGMHGTIASATFTTVVLFAILPFVRLSQISSEVIWSWAIMAGIFGAIGLLTFNSGLSQLTPKNMAPYFILMIVVQIAVPGIYHAIQNGRLTLKECIGITAAVIAALSLGSTGNS